MPKHHYPYWSPRSIMVLEEAARNKRVPFYKHPVFWAIQLGNAMGFIGGILVGHYWW